MFGNFNNLIQFTIQIYNDVDLERTIIFVSDEHNHRIMKFDSDGNFLKQWGTRGKKINEFNKPKGIYVSNDKKLYVCDYSNHRIQVFDLDGNFEKIFAPGNFIYPSNITISAIGEVYICDGDIPSDDPAECACRLQVFDQLGQRIKIVDIHDNSTYYTNNYVDLAYSYANRENNVIIMG